MNIAIIGYGNMGKEIERAAKIKNINVKSIIDNADKNAGYEVINEKSMEDVDVCIDFTSPKAVVGNIKKIAGFSKNIVVGTTGWYGKINEVKQLKLMVDETHNYAFDFLEWKNSSELKKRWLAHTRQVCPRCDIPFVREYLGKHKRRTFYCNNCQVLYK